VVKEKAMSNATDGERGAAGPDVGNPGGIYKRDFWSKEKRKFDEPHYRLEKAARIITRTAGGKRCTLLDVGCGPATLRRVLPSNIEYYGIDMAIHEPAPNLLEADLLETPIGFGDKRFDIVIAQGVFEYMGDSEAQKFAEIASILSDDGTFIVTYWNYHHRNTKVYWAHNNVRPLEEFRKDLAREFTIDRYFPSSHNWYHGSPSMKFNKALNMHLNLNVPVISPKLAVEYFFVCSPRSA
jgi:SAM-dependent methyltransferase